MIGTERLLADSQRSFVERLGIGVAALVDVERSQIVQRPGDVGMIRSKRLLVDRQRPLIEWLGFGVAALVDVDPGQIVQRQCDIRDDQDPSAFS